MVVMYVVWLIVKRSVRAGRSELPRAEAGSESSVDPDTRSPSQRPLVHGNRRSSSKDNRGARLAGQRWYNDWFDVVDIHTVDLYRDEYEAEEEDLIEDEERQKRLKNTNLAQRTLWRLYYLFA